MANYCEDYPCCGHTPADPCERMPYDDRDYFRDDVHLMCDHAAGFCDAWSDEPHTHDNDDLNSLGLPWCYGCDDYADDTCPAA